MAEKHKSSNKSKIVHYIIAVHGIGQQRKNETVLPVIKQFAAARHKNPNQAGFLTLGRLTSQSKENQWIEYQDIPNDPDPSLKEKPWIPRVANDKQGTNLRFVDFCWSDVTREQHKKVGEPTEVWSQSLINRLKLRVSLEQEKQQGKGKPTQWLVDMMETLQEGFLFTEKILDLRLPKLSYEIFGEFLGDVEMYGDFPHTRGRAVRLFHESMDKLHTAHCAEFDGQEVFPHYTIIAHSLGTVMTLDAIAYAHANKQSRKSTYNTEGKNEIVHLPGYDGSLISGEECHPVYKHEKISKNLPNVEWVKYLCSYVTLGSPIDKYLALWTENYAHFANTDWMDKKLLKDRKTSIRHFNYSDEQDPVGHELNILKSTPVWQALMESNEDIVFARYPVPGVAHVGYWQDYDLFNRILDLSIDKRDQQLVEDEKPKAHYVEWFDFKVYLKALLISYILIPIVGWFFATISLDTVFSALIKPIVSGGSAEIPWVAVLIFFVTITITHILMQLIIKWHLVMGEIRSDKSPAKEKKQRKVAQAGIQSLINWSPVLWGVLFTGVMFPVFSLFIPELLLPYLLKFKIGLFMAFAVSLDIWLICSSTRNKWKNLKDKIVDTSFIDYLKPLQK